jgi:predicted PurR-regulated permease PerM
MNNGNNNITVRKVFMALAIATIIATIFMFFWYAVHFLLVAFAGMLLAVLLSAFSEQLSKYLFLPYGLSLTIVILVIICLVGVAIWLLAPEIVAQANELFNRLPLSIQHISHYLERFSWGKSFITQISKGGSGMLLAQAANIFTITFDVIAGIAIILFVGVYTAAEPELYKEGFVRLIPPQKRQRAREVLNELTHMLRWWLFGRSIAMILVGLLTSLGLFLLGLPFILTLGLIAAILTFIPYIGPIISVVPAALVAVVQSPILALYVVILYLAIHLVEGYVITPLIQKRTVSLPPTLTLLSQGAMATLLGPMGLVLASPLAATTMVIIKTLYIEDTLGNSHS